MHIGWWARPRTSQQAPATSQRAPKLPWISAASRSARLQIAGLSVAVLTLAYYVWLYADTPGAHAAGSDGFYSWLYARSLAFDGDMNFANDYALCGDPFHLGIDRGTHRPDNPYYMGPAVFWVPVLVVARLFSSLLSGMADPVRFGCTGPLAMWTLAVGPVCGAFAVWLSYRLARRVADDASAAIAAGLFAFAGTIAFYATILPSYSHVYQALCTALLLVASIRADEDPQRWSRWAMAGLALALCVLQRLPDAVLALVPLALILRRRGDLLRTRVLRAAVVLGGGALAIALTLASYKYLYGTFFAMPQGRYYVQLGHSHPWLALFAFHGGLFHSTPVAWIAVIGAAFAIGMRSIRWLSASLLVASALTIWVSAAALDWHGWGTWGARRLTGLTPVFVFFAAIALARARQWLVAGRSRTFVALGIAFGIPFAFTAFGEMKGLSAGRIPMNGGLTQAELHGEGVKEAWSIVDNRIGDLATLPAGWYFRLRYGLPVQRYRNALDDGRYVRARDLHFQTRDFALTDAALRNVAKGLSPAEKGMAMVERRATILLMTQWPHATEVRVDVTSHAPARLRAGFGRWLGTKWLGEGEIVGTGSTEPHTFAIPPGVFESGLVELALEVDGPTDGSIVIENIRFDDTADYPPAY
jgi:hypothetical protein